MNLEKQKESVNIMYILAVIGLFTGGLFMIAGLIVAYIKKSDVDDLGLSSHIRFYIRTFWYSFLWSLIGMVTAVFLVGFVVLAINIFWLIYRVIKGFLALRDGKGMYDAPDIAA